MTTAMPKPGPAGHEQIAPVIPLPRRPAAPGDAYIRFLEQTLLAAAAALRRGGTPAAALSLLRSWDGPEEIRAAAAELLDTLSGASDH
jgi:hypothetical protein